MPLQDSKKRDVAPCPISMRRLLKPAISLVRLAFRRETTTTCANISPRPSNSLLNLPNELLLHILTFLEDESYVLLSLSCKLLHSRLSSHLNFSLLNKPAKLRLLKCLEPDYPKYMTCHSCAIMFKWDTKWAITTRCPRANGHTSEGKQVSHGHLIQGGRTIFVTPEVLELIWRAHERGPEYGLPISYLNTSGTNYEFVFHQNEARFMDGQVVLASRLEVESESKQSLTDKARSFNADLCSHVAVNEWCEKDWEFVQDAVAKRGNWDAPRRYKCPFCETDHQLTLHTTPGGQVRLSMTVWRNYGRRHGNLLTNKQVFMRFSQDSSRINADELRRRNLQGLFTAASPGTESCEDAKATEPDL